MRAVVVALGKIGLPLAAKIALAGHEVIGCDIAEAVVDPVNRAQPPFPGEAGVAQALQELVPAGKETAFSGAFPLHAELERRGALRLASDPMFTAEELRALGFTPWEGAAVDAAVVQADHSEYGELGPTELPGVRVVLDGRGVIDPAHFAAAGVPVRAIGRPLAR